VWWIGGMRLASSARFHMQTLVIYKLGFNQNYYTFTLILLIKIVLCSKFRWTTIINYKCFDMRLWTSASSSQPHGGHRGFRCPPKLRVYVTKSVPRMALKLISSGKLTFAERLVGHRVVARVLHRGSCRNLFTNPKKWMLLVLTCQLLPFELACHICHFHLFSWPRNRCETRSSSWTQSPVQTLIIYKLGFNQNYYIFTLILLIKIVLCISLKISW